MMGNLKVTDHNSDIIVIWLRLTLKVPLPQIAHKSIVPLKYDSMRGSGTKGLS